MSIPPATAAGTGLRARIVARGSVLARRYHALPDNARGAIWLIFGAAAFSILFMLVKSLEGRLNPLQVTFVRSLIGAAFSWPLLRRVGLSGLRTNRPLLLVARSVFATIALALAFYAVAHLKLADAQAISFAATLFVIPLAAIFLGEKIGPRRWGAALVGFIGVLIVLRPSGEMHIAALAAVASALAFAMVLISVRGLSSTLSADAVFLYGVWGMVLVSAGPAFFYWTAPTSGEWIILAAIAGVGLVSQYCYVQAYAIGEATAIAPADYMKLVFAIAGGLLVFGEQPDVWMFAGSAVIVASTAYITWREAQVKRGTKTPSTEPAASAPLAADLLHPVDGGRDAKQ